MRTKAVRLLLVMVCALATPFVWGATGDPGLGLTGTSHDFSGVPVGSEVTGKCTFCHTPHRNITQSLLWNQEQATQQNYSWTAGATAGGTDYAPILASSNSPSLKCLACHDGSTALGDIAWFNAQNPSTTFPGGVIAGGDFQVGGGNSLDGNHPVGMPYPLGAQQNTYNTSTVDDTLSDWEDPPLGGIVLYTDTAGVFSKGGTAGSAGIECGSCHDVHNGSDAIGAFFLYGDVGGNAATYICSQCHAR